MGSGLFFFFYCFLFIYLFLAVLGLHCCLGFSLVAVSGGCSVVAVCGLLIEVVSLVDREPPGAWASVAVALGLSCWVACGIFLD